MSSDSHVTKVYDNQTSKSNLCDWIRSHLVDNRGATGISTALLNLIHQVITTFVDGFANFVTPGVCVKAKSTGRPRTSYSAENVARVQTSFARSLSKSLRRARNESLSLGVILSPYYCRNTRRTAIIDWTRTNSIAQNTFCTSVTIAFCKRNSQL